MRKAVRMAERGQRIEMRGWGRKRKNKKENISGDSVGVVALVGFGVPLPRRPVLPDRVPVQRRYVMFIM